ncbi:hypothetical protein P1J78_06300 [Psychromarinibacter sp. C21-152]|uniref:Uncharacterized protein n=1 Tax=Psychromarinibacter sediminicola TaxID=3033385 RepID=A0AAE3NQ09_9RHOB|nr:hypothetical protein [Psychromarinibacter sediminicola]MDF0600334.1 hypothetical protein [Psychromarinibacter sediminicola]
MKAKTLLSLALGLALAGPAAAYDLKVMKTDVDTSILVGPTIKKVDDDILYPIPKKKIPIPRPGCLSCPPMPVDRGGLALPAVQ